jgi:surface antigen
VVVRQPNLEQISTVTPRVTSTFGGFELVTGMNFRVVPVVVSAVLLAACSTSSRTDAGGGGLLGGLSGSSASSGGRVANNIIAALNGGLVGGPVGAGLSEREKRNALEAEYRALEYTASGQPVPWQGNAGRSGEVVAAQPYRVGSQDCRQYKQTVIVGGVTSTARGTACRNPDGSWSLLS